MRVFLSYAVGAWDMPMAARLRAVAAAYDIAILLPDRTLGLNNGLAIDTQKKIQQSDAVIALVTHGATQEATYLVNLELHFAEQSSKPVISLVEFSGSQLQLNSNTQVVYFDRAEPTAHERQLVNALQNIRLQKSKNDLAALGWIAGIA